MTLKGIIAKSPLKDVVLKQLGTFGHLPKYFIPGVEKCGTTTLYDYMIQHPQIEKSQTKESFFFDKNFSKGLRWYKGFYQKPNCIDATPTYYRDVRFLKRLNTTVPEGKHVVILREPIARFESAWNMNLVKGWDERNFDQIFAEEYPDVMDGYIGQGLYHRIIENMFEIFGEGNVHVMFLEELQDDTILQMNRVFNFLGLHQCFVSRLPVRNRGRYVRRLNDRQRATLKMIYDPANDELSKLLKRGLPWT